MKRCLGLFLVMVMVMGCQVVGPVEDAPDAAWDITIEARDETLNTRDKARTFNGVRFAATDGGDGGISSSYRITSTVAAEVTFISQEEYEMAFGGREGVDINFQFRAPEHVMVQVFLIPRSDSFPVYNIATINPDAVEAKNSLNINVPIDTQYGKDLLPIVMHATIVKNSIGGLRSKGEDNYVKSTYETHVIDFWGGAVEAFRVGFKFTFENPNFPRMGKIDAPVRINNMTITEVDY